MGRASGGAALPGAFGRLWAGSAVSNLADGVVLAAAPLLAAALTRDPLAIAGLTVAQRLPWLLFSLLTGALADVVDRRQALRAANAVRTLALAALAVTVAVDATGLPVLYAAFFVLGAAETLFDNASAALVPAVVDDARLERANGRLQSAQVVGNDFLGPPLGGVLFAAAAAAPFALGAAGYAVSLALLSLLPRAAAGAARPGPSAGRLLADLRSGARWFRSSPVIRALCVLAAVGNGVTAATYGLLVLVAQERMGLDARGYGLLLAGGSVGAVLGGLGAGRLGRRIPTGTLLLVTNVLSAAAVAALGAVRDPRVGAGLLAVDGFLVLVQAVVSVSLRQRLVPPDLLGRVTGVYRTIGTGAFTVGGLAGGVLARYLGLSAPFFAGAALLVLTSLALLPLLGVGRVAGSPAVARPRAGTGGDARNGKASS